MKKAFERLNTTRYRIDVFLFLMNVVCVIVSLDGGNGSREAGLLAAFVAGSILADLVDRALGVDAETMLDLLERMKHGGR